jgi:hypothetical protein
MCSAARYVASAKETALIASNAIKAGFFPPLTAFFV